MRKEKGGVGRREGRGEGRGRAGGMRPQKSGERAGAYRLEKSNVLRMPEDNKFATKSAIPMDSAARTTGVKKPIRSLPAAADAGDFRQRLRRVDGG